MINDGPVATFLSSPGPVTSPGSVPRVTAARRVADVVAAVVEVVAARPSATAATGLLVTLMVTS